MKEIWKDIIGYEGKYKISNTGKIKSLNYNNTRIVKELRLKENKYGYLEVELSKNNKKKSYMVGRLVAIHFIPNPLFKEEVIHISKDAKDNRVENLRWAYHSESKHHMYNKGCRKKGFPTYTKISYNGKNYNEYKEIAKDIGINKRTFYKRINKLHWNLYEALEVPVGRRTND